MDLEKRVKAAAKKRDITGILAMAEHSDLSYIRAVKVWKGDESAKLADVRKVLQSVGYDLKVVKC